jgi:hypothetical protein
MAKKLTRLTLEIQETVQDLEMAGAIDPAGRDEIYALVGRPSAPKVKKHPAKHSSR